jgi:hypothetical protein
MINRYNILINYKINSYKMTLGLERRLQLSSKGNLSMDRISTGTTGAEVGLVFVF